MNHLYKNEQTYYLLNTEKMKVYKIADQFNGDLDAMNKDELKEMAQAFKVFDSDTKKTIVPFDPDTCKRLILNLTNDCNLDCKYCYAEGGHYGTCATSKHMTLTVLKQVVDKALALYPKGIIQVQFFGGEPLLNHEVMTEGIEYINSVTSQLNLEKPLYSIVTNGTLIDDQIIKIFNQHFHSVTISLDGMKVINDSQRVFKASNESVYDKVKSVIEKINQGEKKFSLALEGTIHKGHVKAYEETKSLQSLKAMKEMNVDLIHISPMLSEGHEPVDYKNYFKAWVTKELESGGKQIKTRTLASLIHAAKNNQIFGNGCGATNTDLASDIYGDLYPCFMFIDAKPFKIGHVSDDFNFLNTKNKTIRETLNKANDNEVCNSCWIKPICAKSYGHCIGARYLCGKDVDEPISTVCEISQCVLETIFSEFTND